MILEVGPGTNRSYMFNPYVSNAVYLDVEPPTLEVKKYGTWVIGDAQHLPFRSNAFSKIIAHHVLEHLRDPDMFLREAYRVLKKEGILSLRVPNVLSRSAYLDPDHKHVFNFLSLYLKLKPMFTVLLPFNAGSMLGKLRKPLTFLINMLSDEIIIEGVKK